MALTIELPPEVEAELIANAEAQGLDLTKFIEHVLRSYVERRQMQSLSPAERADAWRQASRDLPHTPPLSDDAIRRSNLYGDRGQ